MANDQGSYFRKKISSRHISILHTIWSGMTLKPDQPFFTPPLIRLAHSNVALSPHCIPLIAQRLTFAISA